MLDQRALEARDCSVPRTKMLGIWGDVSPGEMGVSSNSVVGVSGFQPGVMGSLYRAVRDDARDTG